MQDLDALWKPSDLPATEAVLQALLPEAEILREKDPGPLVELHCWIGRAQLEQCKFSDARESLERAKEVLTGRSAQDITNPAPRIRWLIEQGRFHVFMKTPSQSQGLFSEAWGLANNPEHDYFAVEIAQLMAATQSPKSQQSWIERAIEIAESSKLEKTRRALGVLYSALGWKYYDLRQYKASLESFIKAVSHAQSLGMRQEAFVAQWSVGKLLRALGRTEEALSIQQALFSELGIGGKRDGKVYEELAECLQALKRTAEAQPYFELAYLELSKDEWATDNRSAELKRMKDFGKAK